jgi:hypothetical protein
MDLTSPFDTEVLITAQPYRNVAGCACWSSTARVIASSTPSLAPCPRCGVTAWAASPSRVMRSVNQVFSGARS